ncbi:chromosome segregation protein SMC [Brotaphodocola sp.]|uniref:chromosome segregation protein SMC n=1 Tax=Brotaphodocola sp. TaxID=3073577 RepID=UPI003D7D3C56
MYLKSIEIQGFKSFANRILFEFHNGITGIVGPNGSGKSNVADAVRWVLGEQRVKQLRGGTMQDVIFAGTQLRRPQGFAYVAITLDNSDHQLAVDFDEVTVSRRLYRSGESEYRINGTACRLKDVNELFYDTGIGKEGYSIIGQGQIDKILSGKPEERRELFDEAAGIVKFKRRKALAQKKLEDEKQNLVRVTDILAELEKQVGPLERQAETAKKYLALREDQKRCEVNQFLMETEEFQTQAGQIDEKLEIASSDLSQVHAQSDQLKESYGKLEEETAELDLEISEKRTLLNQHEMEKGNLEGQINVLHEQINTEKMNAEHIRSRMESVTRDLEDRDRQLESYRAAKEEASEKAGESSLRLEAESENLRSQDENLAFLEQKIEEAKNGIITALNEKASLGAREQRYEAMLEQVQVRRSEVSQKLLKIKSDESVQDEQIEAQQTELARAGVKLEEIKGAQAESERQTALLEKTCRKLRQSLSDAQQEQKISAAKLDSLKNLAERYEGYGSSTRRVMEQREHFSGIHGVVADLITTKKKYETAIETALGGSIQNVVTDSEQTAKELIEYLKKNRFGRVTFLPLTSIGQGGGFSKSEALTEPGVIGLASDLVSTEPQYQVLAIHLLGRVLVVDTIDHAIALAKKFRYTLRIVTLEGELLSAGGSMTGGAFKNTSNLLGRKRELEELENACVRAGEKSQRLAQELKEQESALSKNQRERAKLSQSMQEAMVRYNTCTLALRQIETRREEIRESSRDLVLENGQLETQLKEIEANRRKVKKETELLAEKNEEFNQEISERGRELEEAKRTRERASEKLDQIRMEASALKQNELFAQENIKRVQEEIRKLREELAQLQGGSEGSEDAVEQKKKEIEQIRARISDSAREKEELSATLEKRLAEREAKGKRQKEFFDRREALTGQISQLDREVFRLQSQREKLEEKQDGRIHYLWNEYELTPSVAKNLKDPALTDLSELRAHAESLKQQVRSLGNVNVNAIEAYKEISERYLFMKGQHEDLVQAEEALVKIIEELDLGMRRQFEEKFKEIRQEFDRVFQELFGGGHGTLNLQEDEDILEAGIQIIAQPPGKKLQNMMQLSGGEKALTAISLLFAIQNLKPSPFCLLDEIEAALDDSNVDRFAGYLGKLTANTQFIVITHRRGTMMASDRLYGITMQEKGVSTLVSVSLIEDQLEE